MRRPLARRTGPRQRIAPHRRACSPCLRFEAGGDETSEFTDASRFAMRGLLHVLSLPPRPAKGAGAAAPSNEKLSEASNDWRQTHQQANERIASLKVAVKAHYAKEHPEIVREVDKGAWPSSTRS